MTRCPNLAAECIVERAANVAHLVDGPATAHAVRQQDEVAIEPGSIQSDVPVKPTWPKAAGDMWCRTTTSAASCPSRARANSRPPCSAGWQASRAQVRERPLPPDSPRRRQDRPRESADATCGAEQPGMTGDAAERRGVVVVHFASEQAAAADVFVERPRSARTDSRRSRAANPSAAGARPRPGAQGVDTTFELAVERRAAAIGRQKSQQDETEIAVERPSSVAGTRGRSRRCRARIHVGPRAGGPTSLAGRPDACSRRSRIVAASRSAPRHSANDLATGSSSAICPALHERQQNRRRGDRLGQRGEVEDVSRWRPALARRRSACRTLRARAARSPSPTSATAPGTSDARSPPRGSCPRVQSLLMRSWGRACPPAIRESVTAR